MRDGHRTLSYDPATNRITTPGFIYDAAGNQTRAQRADGTWQRYQYDAAGRLRTVTDDAGVPIGKLRLRSKQATLGQGHQWRSVDGFCADLLCLERRPGHCRVHRDDATSAALDANAAADEECHHLGDRLLATAVPGQGGEVVRLPSGSTGTRVVTNGANATVTEQVTLPFGVSLGAETTGATNPRFTSYDRSGLTNLHYA